MYLVFFCLHLSKSGYGIIGLHVTAFVVSSFLVCVFVPARWAGDRDAHLYGVIAIMAQFTKDIWFSGFVTLNTPGCDTLQSVFKPLIHFDDV